MAVWRTTFPIDAPSDVVWDVLTDLERYPEWNPSVPSIAGEVREGSELAMTLGMPGRPSAKVKATLLEVDPGRRLTWHGNIGADFLFAGDREFHIESREGTAVVTHVENVRGLIFPLFRAAMGGAIRRHHEGFNDALKARAEDVHASRAASASSRSQ